METIPRHFKTVVLDRAINILASIADLMIQMELHFEHHLDEDRLNRAMDLILDAEPVLGCRFVTRSFRPCWERLEKTSRRNFEFVSSREAYEFFKKGSIDPYLGPQVRACLWRKSEGDSLILKVAHNVSDAGGLKETAAGISRIYSRLAHEPEFVPDANTAGSRSVWQVMRHLPWHAYPQVLLYYFRKVLRNSIPLKTHTLPVEKTRTEGTTFALHHLPAGLVDQMMKYGKRNEGTLNDMILAAMFRAYSSSADWNGDSQLRFLTTVDLRRYLPSGSAGGICNLSAIENHHLGTDTGSGFNDTLLKVRKFTSSRKKNWIGFPDFLGVVPVLGHLPYRWLIGTGRKIAGLSMKADNMPNGITNMGLIDPSSIIFDKAPGKAWLLVPPSLPPQFVTGISGYRGTLTLSAGFEKESMKQVTPHDLFDTITEELMEVTS